MRKAALLNHPTLDRLRELGLDGMAKGFCDLAANPESRALEHAEWLGLLVEQEATLRQQKRFEARAPPSYAMQPPSRTSISGPRVVSTGRCSCV